MESEGFFFVAQVGFWGLILGPLFVKSVWAGKKG